MYGSDGFEIKGEDNMDLNRNTVIAVDFDGTLCKSAWPEIGEENHKLIMHLRQQAAEGARLILWTCRCGDMLEAAVEWCRERGLEFDTVNENLPELIGLYGNDCRKINADIYIDDKAVNPIPYRQAAGFVSLNPYKNPIDEREAEGRRSHGSDKTVYKNIQKKTPESENEAEI